MKELTLLYILLLSPLLWAYTHENPSVAAYTQAGATIEEKEGNGIGFTYKAPQTLSGLPFDDVAVLAHVLYSEVRGERHTEAAMRAVGEVVLNRVNSNRFPNDIASVVWQPSNNPNRPRACQFSAFCDPSVDLRMLEVAEAGLAFKVAEGLLTGSYGHMQLSHGATHFLRYDVLTNVSWEDKMEFKVEIDNHRFYLEGNTL